MTKICRRNLLTKTKSADKKLLLITKSAQEKRDIGQWKNLEILALRASDKCDNECVIEDYY
jgi:hypothetical protein